MHLSAPPLSARIDPIPSTSPDPHCPSRSRSCSRVASFFSAPAQIHQSVLLGCPAADDERASSGSSSSSAGSGDGAAADAKLWTHDSRGLLRPVFRFLEIDPQAWTGLEETAASSEAKHHIGAFLRIIFEEDGESSSDRSDQELALAKGVDVMAMSLGSDTAGMGEPLNNYTAFVEAIQVLTGFPFQLSAKRITVSTIEM